ncbi:hypothetical protein WJX84_008137 [Apatococcus fuscideae]|uniref:Uncharacterized protein n=1 Tax=Apatococcus fuscideae TaxID=2026836 RepID=A0AAW1SQP3_9CHLO
MEMMVDTDAPSPQPVPAANPGSARDTFSGGCGAVEAAETLIELPQRPAAHEGTNIKGSRDAFLFFTGGRSGRNSVTGGSDASELKAAKALSPAGAVPMPSAAEAPGGHVSTPHPMLTPPIPAYATHTVPEEAEDGEQSLKRRRLVDALVDELDDGNREGLEAMAMHGNGREEYGHPQAAPPEYGNMLWSGGRSQQPHLHPQHSEHHPSQLHFPHADPSSAHAPARGDTLLHWNDNNAQTQAAQSSRLYEGTASDIFRPSPIHMHGVWRVQTRAGLEQLRNCRAIATTSGFHQLNLPFPKDIITAAASRGI